MAGSCVTAAVAAISASFSRSVLSAVAVQSEQEGVCRVEVFARDVLDRVIEAIQAKTKLKDMCRKAILMFGSPERGLVVCGQFPW